MKIKVCLTLFSFLFNTYNTFGMQGGGGWFVITKKEILYLWLYRYNFRILSYAVWMRWGRVGYKGQNSWTTSGADLDAAKSVFTKKFQVSLSIRWLGHVIIIITFLLFRIRLRTCGRIDTASRSTRGSMTWCSWTTLQADRLERLIFLAFFLF